MMRDPRLFGFAALLAVAASGRAAAQILINTDAMTISGDGDGNPRAFKGVPVVTQIVDGVATFHLAGDFHLADGEIMRVTGARPLSFVVGGNATVAAGATIDVSALGTQAFAGGGLGGGGGAPGAGGAGGVHPVLVDGYARGGQGGAGGQGGNTFSGPAGSPTIGYFGGAGSPGYPGGEAGFSGYGGDSQYGFNSAKIVYTFGGNGGARGGSAPAPAQGGQPGTPGVIAWQHFVLGEVPVSTVQNAGDGGPGFDGANGGDGQDGQPGRGGAHDAPGNGVILVGGNGGSGGGGGGAGAGGSSGSGGGGGGGGARLIDGSVAVGGAGNGGNGGWGGRGGDGGSGGQGGAGGAGGGALELHVYGRADIHGSLLARGGDGQTGQQGAAGNVGALGWAGVVGESFSSTLYPNFSGDDGGNGGSGGNGGNGGRGGHGGLGGGGAGGTLMLVASQLNIHASAQLDAAGGNRHRADDTTGQAGRVLFGSNLAPTLDGAVVAQSTASFGGPVNRNPFASYIVDVGVIQVPIVVTDTPRIVELVGGPEAFGLHAAATADTLAGDLGRAVSTARRAGHVALLLKLVDSSELAGGKFLGHSAFALINLTDKPVSNPQLQLTPITPWQQLLLGGWTNDPKFGGSGAKVLHELDPGAIYVTLIPESLAAGGQAGITWRGQEWSVSWSGSAGQNLAIGIGFVPEPTGAAMGLIAVAWARRWRGRRPAPTHKSADLTAP